MADATWNCCRLGAHSVYTIQPCTSLQCHFIWSHMHSVHAYVAITCHLHLWQNDWDLLHATAVTGMEHNKRAQKEKNKSPAKTQTHNLSVTSPALHTTELSQLPQGKFTSGELTGKCIFPMSQHHTEHHVGSQSCLHFTWKVKLGPEKLIPGTHT